MAVWQRLTGRQARETGGTRRLFVFTAGAAFAYGAVVHIGCVVNAAFVWSTKNPLAVGSPLRSTLAAGVDVHRPRQKGSFDAVSRGAGAEAEAAPLKDELFGLVAASNRATDKSKDEEIIAAFEALEKLNTCEEPLASPQLKGEWELLWTTSDSILGLSRPWLFRPRAKKPILQYLDPENGFARNLEYTPLGKNRVEAQIAPVREGDLENFPSRPAPTGLRYGGSDRNPSGSNLPQGPDLDKNTVRVKFVKFVLFGLLRFKAPERAVGVLQVTYLDDELRLSRGDRGNLFILRKVGDTMTK